MARMPTFLRSTCAAALLTAAAIVLPFTASAFDLQGHRGARGLAPENTLTAFEQALKTGVTTLELDIALTSDGVPVISHDPYLNPLFTRDASGKWLSGKGPLIRSLTLAQVQTYDVGRINPSSSYAGQFPTQVPRDGERIPTLASLFELTKRLGANDIRYNIEIKINPTLPAETATPQEFTDAILRVVREAGTGPRVAIQGFDWRAQQAVQKADPSIATAYLTVQNARSDSPSDPAWMAGMLRRNYASVPHMVKAAGGTYWSPNGPALTAELVKQAQGLGLKVIPWTINAKEDMARFIDWGVDGIITDYPDRLREVMEQKNLPLPRTIP